MSKVLGFGLVLAVAILMNRSATVGVEIGGATWWTAPCDARVAPEPCSGSFYNSSGCGAFSVMLASGWWYDAKLSATPVGNCNTNSDTTGVACRALANQDTLSTYACSTWF